ncbi:hypothetical protein D6D00_05611 [Aureobasidium pullulans]|nr:hypothetical protein D6D00_05611 [Aureobasidium pullulans]
MSPPPHIPGAFPDRSKLLSVDGSGCTRDRTARSAGPSPEPQDVRSDRAAHHRKPGQQIGMIAVDETVEYSAPVGQLVEDIEMKDAKRNSSSARTADEPQDVGKKGDRTIGELIEMLSMETADTWSSSDKLCEEVEKKGVDNIFAPDFSVLEAQRPENKKSQTSCYDFVGVTASPAKSMSDLPATGPKQTCNFMQQLSVPQPSQDSPVPEPLPVKKEVARKAHSPDSSGVHTQRPQTSSPAFMPMDIFKDDFSPSPPSTTCPEERYNPQQWHELYATLPPPRLAEQGMSALHGYTSTELNATNLGAANSRGMDDGHLYTAMHGYGIPSSTLQQLYAPFNPIHHQRQPQFGNPNDGFDTIFDIKSLPLAPAQDRLRQASQGTEEKAPCYLPVPRHEQGTPPVPATQSPHNGFCPKKNNPQIYGKFPASPWEPSDAAESEAAASIKEKEEASMEEKAEAKVQCATAATAAAQNPQQNELNRPLDEPEQMKWEVKSRRFYKSGPPFDLAFSSEERDRQLTRFLDFSVDGSDGDFEEEEEEDAVARMRAQVAQTVQARVSFDDFSSDEGYALSKVPLNDDDSGDETSFEGVEILYGEDVDVEMKDLDDREDEEGEWMLV